MTGRPGHRTMERKGRGAVSYLVRTPRVPFFMLILIGLEAKGFLAFQGRRGIASLVQWNPRPVIFGVAVSFATRASGSEIGPTRRKVSTQVVGVHVSFLTCFHLFCPSFIFGGFFRFFSDFPGTYTGDSQTVICKPYSENSWTKG